ncbi:MAG: HNH endonuclease signature motif containing protein [Propionibacteriaceae bacterium]
MLLQLPRSRRGNVDIENAQVACPHCHASKGAREFPGTSLKWGTTISGRQHTGRRDEFANKVTLPC